MKQFVLGKSHFFVLSFLFLMSTPYAGTPLWTFSPLTATSISITPADTAIVQYKVTNQSSITHTLAMHPIVGIIQITTGAGICSNPFTLYGQESCVLSLQIIGSQVASGTTNGPVVCDTDDYIQCYRPSAADVLNVNVISNSSFTVGGTISGLMGTVYLENNGTDLASFSSNGSFTFSTPVPNGSPYNVTVATQPTSQVCNVTNGSGTINNTNVTNVIVTCATNSFTVGGTVSGLTGTVVLQNNGADSTIISSNGGFTFATPVAEGSPYNVTVLTQPAGQTCGISNGSGTMGSSNVTNVNVTCSADATTLSTSLSNLVLQRSGIARIITITNTGSSTAQDLAVNLPTFPAGTSAITTCSSTLNAGSSCTITVTPGANATSNCTTGIEPTPGVITVSSSNASSVTTNVVVLYYVCIYQGGYVFAIDDTTSNTSSAGGTTLAQINNSSSHVWANNTSTVTGASSLTNGAQNTTAIVGSSVASGSAAELCTNYTIDSSGNSPCSTGTCYNNWYQPAICQLGGQGQGAGCPAGIQNVAANLSSFIGCGTSNCLPFGLWSSTESNVAPASSAWEQQFSGSVVQITDVKNSPIPVRCVRDFS